MGRKAELRRENISMENVIAYVIKNPGVSYRKMLTDVTTKYCMGNNQTDSALQKLKDVGFVTSVIQKEASSNMDYACLYPKTGLTVDNSMEKRVIREYVSKRIKKMFE